MDIKKLLLVSMVALSPAVALALPIVATPTDGSVEPGTPFRHNLFHDASAGNGANGDILAWFSLDTTMSSSWDPTTGELSLYANLFDDSSLSNQTGTVVATSNNLLGAGFGNFDNSSLGTISFQIFNLAEVLLGTIEMEFFDHQYPGDSQGNVPNSYVGNTLTLWGANGTGNGAGFFEDGTSTLGVDLVIVVPEPSILVLLALGLIGVATSVRKR